jgi:histidinol-phosphate aminotransferase
VSVPIPGHVRDLSPYVPGKPIEEAEREVGVRQVVKLASNENPLGPSPRAIAAIQEAAGRVHRYPDAGGQALRAALAARLRIPAAEIVLGNGSTELVELLAKTLLSGGRGAVVASQAFIMYRIAVRAMGAPIREVPLRGHRHDLDAMAGACGPGTAIVYLGNPNNPTGTCITRGELDRFLARLPGEILVVLDEAYRDYVEAPEYPDGLDDLRRGRSVAVLRTFSKIHGLAGLRIGYAAMPAELAAAIDRVRSPFNTSVIAQAAALAALGDLDHLKRSREENARERAYLCAEFARRPVTFVPSVTNFLLLETALDAQDLYSRLLSQGVIVRPMSAYGFERGIRVSVGSRQENLRFLAALDTALAG